ncbi:DUF4241 domain-containing protein [Agrilutibacter solisilvae]|uniref:DUF4241 domain-containing protein n=1 Tax=Agrilutibacter solisilvae TaxID=2763317 RepID=A0A974XY40_9GAMM|nr:DUF4241 domain-containing protein [Lysobacter solisilvae]QSX77058.1 DUF4241 domain-containing protein [Lysobacter solisilvae]
MAYLDTGNLLCTLLDDATLQRRELARRRAGVLRLTSGRVVACDPFVNHDRAPFAGPAVAPGAYPVDVIAHRDMPVLAALWLRDPAGIDAATLQWSPALLPGQDAGTLADDRFFGYPVDAGTGCFMDADAAEAIAQRLAQEEDPHADYYNHVVAGEMRGQTLDHYPMGDGSAHNVVMFLSGYGDGSYPSFWGLSADGSPVLLVTDFLAIEGGDGRDAETIRYDAYVDGLTPEHADALAKLHAAVVADDVDALRSLIADGPAAANDVIPGVGGTAIFEAIRLDRPQALEILLAGGGLPPVPAVALGGISGYADYARRLKKPRSAALMGIIEAARTAPPGPTKEAAAGETRAAGLLSRLGRWLGRR